MITFSLLLEVKVGEKISRVEYKFLLGEITFQGFRCDWTKNWTTVPVMVYTVDVIDDGQVYDYSIFFVNYLQFFQVDSGFNKDKYIK